MGTPNFQVDTKARVTAGIPGLLPEKRERADEFWAKRDYQHRLFADAEGRKQAAAAPDAGRPTHVKEAQRGIPLEGWLISSRLRKLNPNLHFEVSNADHTKLGVYIRQPMQDKVFLVGMELETNPEFETRVVDDKGACVRTLRGWRTVLAKLIRAKVITEPGAFKLFGPPSRDSENWATLTS